MLQIRLRYLLLAAALLCAIPAHAQNSLQGVVVDSESGQPVPFAAAYISDLKRGALTDSAGRFALNDLPAGAFLLTVSSMGYNAHNVSVDVKGPTFLNISLKPSHMEMQELVV